MDHNENDLLGTRDEQDDTVRCLRLKTLAAVSQSHMHSLPDFYGLCRQVNDDSAADALHQGDVEGPHPLRASDAPEADGCAAHDVHSDR